MAFEIRPNGVNDSTGVLASWAERGPQRWLVRSRIQRVDY
jgi:hypothetical protein